MTEMSGFDSTGPMELAVLEFADPAYDGSMASALSDLVERQIVAIVDLLILRKSSEGEVEVVELADAEGAVGDQFADLDGDVMWLLSDRDVAAVPNRDIELSRRAIRLRHQNRLRPVLACGLGAGPHDSARMSSHRPDRDGVAT